MWGITRPVALASLVLACCGTTAAVADELPPAATPSTVQRPPPRVAIFSTCALPAYPRDDLQARHTGTVDFEVLLNRGGNVLETRMVKSSGYASLDEAVRAAFVKCRFNEVGDAGPVEQWQRIRYVWTIDN